MSARDAAPSLPDKILLIDRALAGGGIAHAFGGALALAYYAEPRSTLDIDVNVFRPPAEGGAVAAALAPLGIAARADDPGLERDGQVRWLWGLTPIDLFFSTNEIHAAMRERIRRVPFGEERIPILGPEHLLICKVAFDRPKDWLDIEQMIFLDPDLDRAEIDRWLEALLAEDDPRRARARGLLEEGR